MLLSDRDRFVSGNVRAQKTTYVVGLDVAGAFDSASLIKLVGTLLYYEVPTPTSRLIGTWLTRRFFRVKLRSPLETALSGDYAPTRGVPQGGVLYPLLWLLHVNRIAEGARGLLIKEIRLPEDSWDVIIQIFADDISAAIGHKDKETVIKLAHILIGALLRKLSGADLDVSIPKCENFLAEWMQQPTREGPTDTTRNVKRRLKEQKRQRMSHDLSLLESQ